MGRRASSDKVSSIGFMAASSSAVGQFPPCPQAREEEPFFVRYCERRERGHLVFRELDQCQYVGPFEALGAVIVREVAFVLKFHERGREVLDFLRYGVTAGRVTWQPFDDGVLERTAAETAASLLHDGVRERPAQRVAVRG